jgi:hypothetical protein
LHPVAAAASGGAITVKGEWRAAETADETDCIRVRPYPTGIEDGFVFASIASSIAPPKAK